MTPGESWPIELELKRGLARAKARPWNQDFPDAHLRVIRGGASFTADSAAALFAIGAPSVISPPLAQSAQSMWRRAAFDTYHTLSVLRLELDPAPEAPDHLVTPASVTALDPIQTLDAEAFEPFWRLDKAGLAEALAATGRAELLVVGSPEAPAGFAILGYGLALSYLQRVAVAPRWAGQHVGRSLVRAAGRRARRAGARAVLLNTQKDNSKALGLYASEGYEVLPEPLELLHKVS